LTRDQLSEVTPEDKTSLEFEELPDAAGQPHPRARRAPCDSPSCSARPRQMPGPARRQSLRCPSSLSRCRTPVSGMAAGRCLDGRAAREPADAGGMHAASDGSGVGIYPRLALLIQMALSATSVPWCAHIRCNTERSPKTCKWLERRPRRTVGFR
jgi:hypothetical protein